MAKILKPTLLTLAVLVWGAWLSAGEAKPAAPKGSTPKATVIVPAAGGDESAGPEARIPTAEWTGENLKVVLDYLSIHSGVNIRALDDKDLDLKVTLSLDNVSWKEILRFLAEKYGLVVDDSREAQGLIVVKSPPKVSIIFDKPTDIREVISAIAAKTEANLIIGPEVKGLVSLSLKNVPWEEALDMVVRTLNFVAVKDKFNTYRITSPDKHAQQLETRVFRLSYLQPEGARYMATITSEFVKKQEAQTAAAAAGSAEPISLLGVLKSMATEKVGRISYMRDTNTLVITDTPTKLEAMQKLIEGLDLPPKQVHMAVRLVELTDSESEELGMEWANGFLGTLTGMGFDTTFPFDASTSSRGASTGRFWGHMAVDPATFRTLDKGGSSALGGGVQLGRLDFTQMTAALRFLKTRTKTSIVQSPSLTALDNQEATIHVGRNIRYAEFDSSSTNSGTSTGYKEASNSPIKEGIQILVVPHVTGTDGNVLMTIVAKTEDFEGFEEFGGTGVGSIKLPQTKQRIVVTKELLRDTETGVIGGLKKTSAQITETKIPVLGDIPVLGWLFKSRSQPADTNARSNLMIFITPTVIDIQKESRVPKAVRDIRRGLAGPFFTYDEKSPGAGGEEPSAAGGGK